MAMKTTAIIHAGTYKLVDNRRWQRNRSVFLVRACGRGHGSVGSGSACDSGQQLFYGRFDNCLRHLPEGKSIGPEEARYGRSISEVKDRGLRAVRGGSARNSLSRSPFALVRDLPS